jgi:hypothetical protein
MNRLIVVTCLGLAICTAVSAEQQPRRPVPGEVRRAEKTLSGWLNRFTGKNRDEVEKMLGAASENATWEFRGKKELLLRFRISAKGTLDLYFFGTRVMKASLQLLSE